jgi:hypothetical protein
MSCIYCYLYIPVRTKGRLWISSKKNRNKKIAKTGNKGVSKLVMHFDTLDQGTEAFMQWLGSDDKMSALSNPIILKQFAHNKYTTLYDNTLGQDVIVETHDGIPRCKSCNTDDCGHIDSQYFLNRNTKMMVPYWIDYRHGFY